ncbi:hypothetical protein N7532_002813 [Penicillium argentinense]|uniref:Uncharacterized protein n=1 Tax=Penicillium argentinense TaxID=1131581 RepID=A0A9W9G160_9EURO|nr:uncharacterized protein N7532_002813 [Penicillium argentinense]KAJ5110168.1 hypothetical protein N7532_002813 [Penicillium argentinense]
MKFIKMKKNDRMAQKRKGSWRARIIAQVTHFQMAHMHEIGGKAGAARGTSTPTAQKFVSVQPMTMTRVAGPCFTWEWQDRSSSRAIQSFVPVLSRRNMDQHSTTCVLWGVPLDREGTGCLQTSCITTDQRLKRLQVDRDLAVTEAVPPYNVVVALG